MTGAGAGAGAGQSFPLSMSATVFGSIRYFDPVPLEKTVFFDKVDGPRGVITSRNPGRGVLDNGLAFLKRPVVGIGRGNSAKGLAIDGLDLVTDLDGVSHGPFGLDINLAKRGRDFFLGRTECVSVSASSLMMFSGSRESVPLKNRPRKIVTALICCVASVVLVL